MTYALWAEHIVREFHRGRSFADIGRKILPRLVTDKTNERNHMELLRDIRVRTRSSERA